MCWNLNEEMMSRAAAFITDCSRDKRCDETPVSVELPSSSRVSVTRVDQSKTVKVRIMQFSPVVLRGTFYPEILTGSSLTGASNKAVVGKTSYFLPLCVNIWLARWHYW